MKTKEIRSVVGTVLFCALLPVIIPVALIVGTVLYIQEVREPHKRFKI